MSHTTPFILIILLGKHGRGMMKTGGFGGLPKILLKFFWQRVPLPVQCTPCGYTLLSENFYKCNWNPVKNMVEFLALCSFFIGRRYALWHALTDSSSYSLTTRAFATSQSDITYTEETPQHLWEGFAYIM